MRIIFFGTPEFAGIHLRRLLNSPDHQVVAVVTVPDKPKGRGRQVSFSAVKTIAAEHHLTVLQPPNLSDESFVQALHLYQADVFVVVAFRILPEVVFAMPAFGTVNVHASLLPAYRGAAPINWALINGDKISGVTTMLINRQVDTGNILLQKSIDIPDQMNAGELHDRLAGIGAELLLETLTGLAGHKLVPLRQNDALASKAPKISPEFCEINFNQESGKVINFIRGLSPYPAAYSFLNQSRVKILAAQVGLGGSSHQEPGAVTAISSEAFDIACRNGFIRVLQLQPEGKKPMTAGSFLNGYPLEVGQKVGK